MKSGVGSARVDLSDGAFIVAMSVVNALGNVISDTGQVLAGNRKSGGGFAEFSEQTLTKDYSPSSSPLASNTTISIVGTNVDLANQEHYTRVANMATHGHSRAIYPVNTSVDGDTLFVFSTEQHKDYLSSRGTWAPYPYWPPLAVDLIGDAAAKAVRLSIYDACTSAKTIPFKSALDGIIPGLAG
jgi:L-aminopeptidase/D-esterase-like protein